MPENRAGDCLPFGSLDAVTGAIQGQEPRSGDLVGERLPVLEREHRIGRAVDDEDRHADRRERNFRARQELSLALDPRWERAAGGLRREGADQNTRENPIGKAERK